MHGGIEEAGSSSTRADAGGERSATSRVRMVAGRRPTLPSSRAVVGGLLVAVAMVGVFLAASGAARGPAGRAVVVRRDLPIGHRLAADDLRMEDVELPPSLAVRTFASFDEAVGLVTLAPLGSDDLLARSALVDPGDAPSGSRSFSFAVERERAVNGHLRAGETVDVVATTGTGESAHTEVVAAAARLLDVEEAARATIGSTGKVVVTLALPSEDDVLRTAQAAEVAAITLVRSDGGRADP